MKGAQSAAGSARFAARAVMFDLDGTLIHTAPDLARAVNQMLLKLGLHTHPEPRIRDWMGSGTERLIKRSLTRSAYAEPLPELFERAHDLFHAYYLENVSAHSRPYPDVVAALRTLRDGGFRLACVTNKPEIFTRPLLEELELDRYLDAVVSGDSLPRRKPDPLQLHHVCEQFGVAESSAVLVGDSRNDVNAAKAAGMPVIVVSYGYSQGSDLTKLGPDAIIDSFAELPAILKLSD